MATPLVAAAASIAAGGRPGVRTITQDHGGIHEASHSAGRAAASHAAPPPVCRCGRMHRCGPILVRSVCSLGQLIAVLQAASGQREAVPQRLYIPLAVAGVHPGALRLSVGLRGAILQLPSCGPSLDGDWCPECRVLRVMSALRGPLRAPGALSSLGSCQLCAPGCAAALAWRSRRGLGACGRCALRPGRRGIPRPCAAAPGVAPGRPPSQRYERVHLVGVCEEASPRHVPDQASSRLSVPGDGVRRFLRL